MIVNYFLAVKVIKWYLFESSSTINPKEDEAYSEDIIQHEEDLQPHPVSISSKEERALFCPPSIKLPNRRAILEHLQVYPHLFTHPSDGKSVELISILKE